MRRLAYPLLPFRFSTKSLQNCDFWESDLIRNQPPPHAICSGTNQHADLDFAIARQMRDSCWEEPSARTCRE